MRRFAPLVVFAAISLAGAQAPGTQAPSKPPAPTGWALGGVGAACYTMEVAGRASDPAGATVSLRSATEVPARQFGDVSAQLPADSFRRRRIKLSAEMQTRGVTDGAWVWLRLDREAKLPVLQSGIDQPVRGDSEWTARSISLLVPEETTRIVFGVQLRGTGSVAVRSLRLISWPADAPIATAAAKVLDEAIRIVKTNALKASDVDWKVVEPEVRAAAAGAEESADTYPAIRLLLSKLGDHHSFLMTPAQTSTFKTGGGEPADVRVLPEKVGYIGVPRYDGAEATAAQAYAKKVHNGIAAAMPSCPCGWIVDLRGNRGGNMWAMLAGLRPFLGDGPLGSVDGPHDRSRAWDANAVANSAPPASLATLQSAWVAVLTGPLTASAGEAVTIAFRGRPRTRSFGLPTAGLSTSNDTFPLADGSMIVLTTAVFIDRTGRHYGDKVEPDERVEGKNATAVNDATIAAAIRWLTQSSGCAAALLGTGHLAIAASGSRITTAYRRSGRPRSSSRRSRSTRSSRRG